MYQVIYNDKNPKINASNLKKENTKRYVKQKICCEYIIRDETFEVD